jgi:hypothetical protein
MAMQGQTAIFVCYEHAPQALLGRLLALELGSLVRPDETSALNRLRPLAEEVALGAAPASALTTDPLGEEAYHRVQQYGPRLHLVQGSGLCTGTVELARVVAEHGAGATALFVDYLQKVPVPGDGRNEEERSAHLVERLKELAMVTGVAVVAIAATDKVGLRTRRVRLHHLRGSAALAHEADVAILVNEKAIAVSKAHLAYDPVRAEHFKRFVVLSIEKNRDGAPDMDLEFRKDLANHRFDPEGGFLAESLVDALLVEE